MTGGTSGPATSRTFSFSVITGGGGSPAEPTSGVPRTVWMKHFHYGVGGVMVWSAISSTGRKPLVHVQGAVNAQRYVAEILQPHVIPRLAAPCAVFQRDNTRPHAARHTTQFLANNNVQTPHWSSISPDLKPIEHI